MSEINSRQSFQRYKKLENVLLNVKIKQFIHTPPKQQVLMTSEPYNKICLEFTKCKC